MVRKDKISHEEFERLVGKTLATLPEEFQSYLENVVVVIEDESPDDMPDVMGLYEGVPLVERSMDGTIRALSLISELVYGVAPSYRDPARYSFAHGGKDGIPYPVDRQTYDRSIELLAKAIHRTRLGIEEKNEALVRLSRLSANG